MLCLDGWSLCGTHTNDCYLTHKVCTHETYKGFTLHCPGLQHLHRCETHECPHMFKCYHNYCLPTRMLCDDNPDCPEGEDEHSCEEFHCAGLLRCRSDDICVHPTDICDGIVHCLISGDDEKLCEMLPCPEKCIYRGTTVKCNDLRNIHELSPMTTAVVISQSSFAHEASFGYFSHLLYLSIINCRLANDAINKAVFAKSAHMLMVIIEYSGIKYIHGNSFESMIKLKVLDVRYNEIREIQSYHFMGLQSMRNLDLSHFKIRRIRALSFFGLTDLKHLNLSANCISTITYSACHGLTSIQDIDLTLNKILFIEDLKLLRMFAMNSVTMYFDAKIYCCTLHKSIRCFVGNYKIEPQNCDPLVKVEICYIKIGISLSATIFNFAIVLLQKSVNKSSTHYKILKHLLMANLIHSCYLLIRDVVYISIPNENIYFYTTWLESVFCYILNVSFFIGVVIPKLLMFILVLDQLVAVKYVLKKHLWSGKVM